MTPPAESRSFADLLGIVLAQCAKLVQNEIDLARAELADKIAEAKSGMVLIAVGAVIVIPALAILLLAAAAELIAMGFSAPTAFLCTGVAAAVVAILLVMAGFGRLARAAAGPSLTLQQIRRDAVAARESMR